jgi:hypothetical protein
MSVMTYRLEVRAKQPLAADADCPDYPTLEHAASFNWKHNVERNVAACLSRCDLECDVELMDFTVEDE